MTKMEKMQKETEAELIQHAYIKGYDEVFDADTLFKHMTSEDEQRIKRLQKLKGVPNLSKFNEDCDEDDRKAVSRKD